MIGKLNNSISNSFEESFLFNCLELFGEAYIYIKNNKNITADWEKENISANFYDYIDKSEKAISWNINISDEHRIFYESILLGKKPAKTASRIDFRLTTNWIEQKKRLEYFIEAKNLIESDCEKVGRKAKINAQSLHKRYVNTGIDNFVSKKYPSNGCLVGYVLQGKPTIIVDKINICLNNQNRTNEHLKKIDCTIPNLDFCYQSYHSNEVTLKHFLLKFSY